MKEIKTENWNNRLDKITGFKDLFHSEKWIKIID